MIVVVVVIYVGAVVLFEVVDVDVAAVVVFDVDDDFVTVVAAFYVVDFVVVDVFVANEVVFAVAVVAVADVGSIVDVALFSIKDSKNVPGGHNCHGNQKCLLTLKQQQDNLANLTISTKRK